MNIYRNQFVKLHKTFAKCNARHSNHEVISALPIGSYLIVLENNFTEDTRLEPCEELFSDLCISEYGVCIVASECICEVEE